MSTLEDLQQELEDTREAANNFAAMQQQTAIEREQLRADLDKMTADRDGVKAINENHRQTIKELRAQLKEWEADRITGQRAIDERNSLSSKNVQLSAELHETQGVVMALQLRCKDWRELAKRLFEAMETSQRGLSAWADATAAYERLASGGKNENA